MDTLEQFREMLYTNCLPHAGPTLSAFVLNVEPESREQALTEAFAWFRQTWRAEGAWEAVRHIPPMVLSGRSEGDARRFTDLLFPFGPKNSQHPSPLYATPDFWRWQTTQAEAVGSHLHPEMPVACRKWLELCRKDPEWKAAVSELARAFRTCLEFEASPRPNWMWQRHQEQSAAARRGEVSCGHVTIAAECVGCQGDFQAYEAHWGWDTKARWQMLWRPGQADSVGARTDCACCSSRHDRRPVGTVSCSYCAEANFWLLSEVLARRWGGWFWLTDELRWDARTRARGVQEVGDLAEGAPQPVDPQVTEWQARQAALGTDPWQSDWLGDRQLGLHAAGTIYLPVRVLTTDLKGDVDARAMRVLDELWNRVALKKPKSAGTSAVREMNWDRYLDWLWQRRVDRLSVPEIETRSGPLDADGLTSPKAIRDGISRAIEVLRAG